MARWVRCELEEGTGPGSSDSDSDSPSDYGGFPEIAGGSPCPDADADGMPDAFERRFSLDEGDPDDARQDPDGDGYLNIEEFLNGSPPR